MLDLRRLAVFHEVANRRSFSAAALALDYTQSTVSQAVTNLEHEVGLTLIDRSARPVRPTEAGQVLLEHTATLLGQARAVEEELARLTGGERGTVRFGAFGTAWRTFVPPAVAAFSRERAGVQLDLRSLEPEPALRAVVAGDLDLAVVYRYDDTADERLTWTHLVDDPYAVVLPAGHRLAGRSRLQLADLAAEKWVSPPPETPYTRLLVRLCRETGGFEPDTAYQVGDVALAQPLVAAGLAVALLPALGLRPVQPGVVVRTLTTLAPARSVSAVQRRGRRTPAAQPLLHALRDSAAELDLRAR